MLALPATPLGTYARHIAAALLLGNSALLSPLTRSQLLIAERMHRACPEQVRLAGDNPIPPAITPDDTLVMLQGDRISIERNGKQYDGNGVADHGWLCGQYARFIVEVTTVRTSYLPPVATMTHSQWAVAA